MANDRDELMRLAERLRLAASAPDSPRRIEGIAADLRALAQRAPQNGAVPEGYEIKHIDRETKRAGRIHGMQVMTPADGEGLHSLCFLDANAHAAAISLIEAMLAAAPAPEAAKCACGVSTCVEPWEPGCGLGSSEEFVVAASEAERAEGEAVPWNALYSVGRYGEWGAGGKYHGDQAPGYPVMRGSRAIAWHVAKADADEWVALKATSAKSPPPAGQPADVEALATEIAHTFDRDEDGKGWVFDSAQLAELARRLASAQQSVGSEQRGDSARYEMLNGSEVGDA